MHNFVRYNISIADSLDEIGSGLMAPKKSFLDANRLRLSELFADYNHKAEANDLQSLKAEWAFEATDDKFDINEKNEMRQLAYGLYESDRIFVNKHWERLKAINGGKVLFCPICGLNVCKEMDHFVPRGLNDFPEYAAHLNNLIPLCHDCNHKKSNKFLDEEKRERLFFNAYYDTLTDREILVGKVTLSPVDGLPKIEVSENPRLKKNKVPDKYILSTIEKLGLMKEFNIKAEDLFRIEMELLCLKRTRYAWKTITEEMKEFAKRIEGDHDIVRPTVFAAIAESEDMEIWFNNLK